MRRRFYGEGFDSFTWRWNREDDLFFPANLSHRSDQNRSDNPRWAMICCYNAARNDFHKDSRHPQYTPLRKVKDEEILQAAAKRFGTQEAEGTWLDPKRDASAASLAKTGSEG